MRLRVSTGWAVTVLLAAVGCGRTSGVSDPGSGVGSGGGSDEPPVMGLDFVQSGSRVVALGYSSNEARLFRTFHDQKLNFDCSFVPDAAGRDQRCSPSAKVTMVYTDASCTEPAAWADGLGYQPPAVGDAVSGESVVETTCPGDAPAHRDAYRVGERLREEALGGSVVGLFQVYGGRCQTAAIPAKIVPAVVRLIPISESELARGQRVSVDVGAGLRLTRLLADDGAQVTVGVTGADGTPCEFQRDGECVPEPIARPASLLFEKFYTALNADCSAPAFQMPYQAACGVPRFGVSDDGEPRLSIRAMDKPAAVFGLDPVEPVSEPISYRCTQKAIGDYAWVAAPGTDVTGTLPIASTLRRGTGQLHVDWFSVAGRELLPAPADSRQGSWGEVPTARFADPNGRACDVTLASDGKLRCVFPDEQTPNADLSTFPEVASFTY